MKRMSKEWQEWAEKEVAAWNLQGELEQARQEREKEGQCLTEAEAIRHYCLGCQGYRVEAVLHCERKDCWLYPWRLGKREEDLGDLGIGAGR